MELGYDVKKRRISEKDWMKVQEYVKKEHGKRKTDSFRKHHELIWKEVDRQVYMKSPEYRKNDPDHKNDWHSAIELGELAKVSEIVTADAMRLVFPDNRSWFESHIELPPVLNPQTGEMKSPDEKQQKFIDGSLRAFMSQQHLDFGHQQRVELSVKEALHHGGFVATARNESAMMVHDGTGIQSISAPVWVPHSMWNCYPDPSPSVIGTNMFYTGSMIVVEYKPRHKLEEECNSGGLGWMPANLKKVSKRNNKNKDIETEDVELINYLGDCVIKREDGDIYLPNSKIILANDTIVFYAPNDLPFPPVIYNGYEKLDVRDPYYVSPLIKLSPMHKVATTILNKYIECISLSVEPPMLYDGNDPSFVQTGGPVFAPGWKGPTKSMGNVKQLETGDPNAALQGFQLITEQIKQGSTADSIPSGGDKTAKEIRAREMRSEVRVVNFVSKLEFSLKTFLYMQHEINKKYMTMYTFYNPEMDAPDFMRITREELPPTARFDVIGSKGILGEEERSQKMSLVVAFASGNPLFAPLLKRVDVLKEMFQDAGQKSPERFINVPDDEFQQLEDDIRAQYEEAMNQAKSQIFDLEKKLAISQAVNGAKIEEAQIKSSIQADLAQFKAEIQAQLDTLETGLKIAESKAKNVQSVQ